MKLLATAFAILAASAAFSAEIDPALRPVMTAAPTDHRPVQAIALFKDSVSFPRLSESPAGRATMEKVLIENARRSQRGAYQQLTAMKRSDAFVEAESLWLVNAMIVTIPASGLNAFSQNPAIYAIVANRIRHISGENTFTGGKFTYGLAKIGIPELREKAPNIDGGGVRVGVIDTGIDPSHPDLAGKLIAFHDFVSRRRNPYDDNGHGTHVSGTIAGGNALGINIGVAPGARLLMAKVFKKNGNADDATLLKAMQWMADPDGNPNTPDYPRVVSNSWGGGVADPKKDPMEEPLCKAIAGWAKLGILGVFAAGNEGPHANTIDIPGACPLAIAVGATNKADQIASFSSRGPVVWKTGPLPKPTVSAPGVDVVSSFPGGGHQTDSGTSMATPHVAGLAALVYQVKPQASVEDVTRLIVSGSEKLGDPNSFGFGRINAFNTVKQALQ